MNQCHAVNRNTSMTLLLMMRWSSYTVMMVLLVQTVSKFDKFITIFARPMFMFHTVHFGHQHSRADLC